MTTLTFRELGRTAWRRRCWFVVPVLVGLAAALVAIEVLPKVYRASTLVMVEPQKVPADYVKPTVTPSSRSGSAPSSRRSRTATTWSASSAR